MMDQSICQPIVELLGPVAIRHGEACLPLASWGKRKARLLLLMLLTSPDSRVARSDAASTLWPAISATADIANNLYTTLHAVRQFLGRLPGPRWGVQLSADMLWLELPGGIAVDWRRFIELANQALAAPRDQALTLAALAVHRGPLNPDPALDEWVWPLREHIAGLHERLLLQLADTRARAGDASAAEPLEQIIAGHPTHEVAVQRLLLLYGAAGRRDAAARLWRRFAAQVRAELQFEPLPETLQIARAVESGRVGSLPLESWQLGAYAPPITIPLPFATPSPLTIGRDEQLRAAEAAAQAAGRGTGRALLISGMAGIGKTHIALTLGARLAGQGWHVLLGSAAPHAPRASYGPLIEALSTYLRYRPDVPLDSLAEQALAQLLGPALPIGYRPATPAAQLPSELLLHLGVVRVLEAATDRAPLALILDDIQWTDPATRALLAFVLRRLRPLRLLLILCYRPAELNDALLAEAFHTAERDLLAVPLPLAGLAPEAATHLLHSIVGELVVPARVAHDVIQRADGNPFFLSELARTWVLSADRTSAPLPAAIIDAIHFRLDRLSPAARSVAEVGALAQTLFTPAVIGAVRHMAAAVVDQAVHELVREQVVRWRSDGTLTFDHALISEVLAAQLAPHLRARLHSHLGRVAQTLQPPPPPAVLLYHFAAGSGAPEDQRALIDAGLAAGRAARSVWALEEAHGAYQQTLAALRRGGGEPALWAEAWSSLAGVAYEQGQYAAARAAYAELAAWSAGVAAREAQRLTGLGWLDYRESQHAPALEHFEAAIASAPPGSPVLTEAQIGLAFVCHLTGQSERARDLLTGTITSPAQGEPSGLQARAFNALAAIEMENGRIDEARAAFEAALDSARECGDIQYHALIALNLANLNVRSGRIGAALELVAAAERTQRDLGNTHHLGRAAMVASWALFYGDDLARAAARLEQALDLLPAASQDYAYALNHLVSIYREHGALARARELAGENLALARAGGFVLAEAIALCELALIGLALGDQPADALEEWARAGVALAQGYRRDAWLTSCWTSLGRVLAARKDQHAATALQEGLAAALRAGARVSVIEARLALAEWWLAVDDPAQAAAELAQADTLAHAAGAALLTRKIAQVRDRMQAGGPPEERRSGRPSRLPDDYEAAVLACFDANPGHSLRAIARAVAASRGEPPRNHHTIRAILERNQRR